MPRVADLPVADLPRGRPPPLVRFAWVEFKLGMFGLEWGKFLKRQYPRRTRIFVRDEAERSEA